MPEPQLTKDHDLGDICGSELKLFLSGSVIPEGATPMAFKGQNDTIAMEQITSLVRRQQLSESAMVIYRLPCGVTAVETSVRADSICLAIVDLIDQCVSTTVVSQALCVAITQDRLGLKQTIHSPNRSEMECTRSVYIALRPNFAGIRKGLLWPPRIVGKCIQYPATVVARMTSAVLKMRARSWRPAV